MVNVTVEELQKLAKGQYELTQRLTRTRQTVVDNIKNYFKQEGMELRNDDPSFTIHRLSFYPPNETRGIGIDISIHEERARVTAQVYGVPHRIHDTSFGWELKGDLTDALRDTLSRYREKLTPRV